MIHFFRRIRQALLQNNKFSKYAAYALGEIALVMIGILLALQVSTWNEKRKATASKNRYCQQLIASLQSDQINLEGFKKRLNQLEQDGQYLWDYVNGDLAVVDTNLFKNYFLGAANLFDFTPQRTVYDNLVESNGMSLIKSDTLKGIFARYYEPQKGDDEVQLQKINYAAAYNDMRFQFVSPMMLKTYLHHIFQNTQIKGRELNGEYNNVLIEQEVDLSAYPVDLDALRRSQEFKIVLGRMLAIREPTFDKIRLSIEAIELMIGLLQKEIE